MLVQFLTRFAVSILLVLIFFFLLFIIVFLLYRRSRKIMEEEEPIITSLENNNVDSFLQAIHEIDQSENGQEEFSPKRIEKDEDTLVQYVSDTDAEYENKGGDKIESGETEEEGPGEETPDGGIKTAIGSFLGVIGQPDQEKDSGPAQGSDQESDQEKLPRTARGSDQEKGPRTPRGSDQETEEAAEEVSDMGAETTSENRSAEED